ncbi:MAG: RNA polymerase factor sigma-54 [Acetobacteraceae bacterium]|nr:RNA polymerase factor sigma-54 [Acetobacteraceae bacterium]
MKAELVGGARGTLEARLSPRALRALALLRAPAPELARLMEREVEENPLLELEPEAGADADGEPAPEGGLSGLEERGQEYFPDSAEPAYPAPDSPRAQPVAPAPTLEEYLRLQIALLDLPPAVERAARFLAGCLDGRGYLSSSLEEVAEGAGVDREVATKALEAVQGLDPPGVGARDLRECLLLQLEGSDAPEAQRALCRAIVREHLDDLAGGRLGAVARALGETPAAVRAAVRLIRGLDPCPGERFSGDAPRYVVPDLVVERMGEGWAVYLNDRALPSVGISPFYRRLLADATLDRAARRFVERRLRSALWFLGCLERRRLTLCRILEFTVKRQEEFLSRGLGHLKPLTMAEAARALGLHESTVSRAVEGKYVQTPHGAFPLRFFFGPGVRCAPGPPLAKSSVKRLMRDILTRGRDGRPLTDQGVAQELALAGIHVSRRTVAKYRSEMGIPAAGGGRGPRSGARRGGREALGRRRARLSGEGTGAGAGPPRGGGGRRVDGVGGRTSRRPGRHAY